MEDKEVVWKCRRGTKELDLMMNGFYENYYKNEKKKKKEAFVKLLSLEDPFISDLLMNKTMTKDIAVNEIADMIRTMNLKA